MVKVHNLREKLHTKAAAMEEIDPKEVEFVNTFSRLERVKQKMRELTARASASISDKKDFEFFHLLFHSWDVLAIDWIYSDVLEFEGSLPDAKGKEIERETAKRQQKKGK